MLVVVFILPKQPLRRRGSDSVVGQREQSHSSPEASVGLQPGNAGDPHLSGHLLLCESNTYTHTHARSSFSLSGLVGGWCSLFWNHTHISPVYCLLLCRKFWLRLTVFLLMHHFSVSNAGPTPWLTLTNFPAIPLHCAFPHQTPLPTLCPTSHVYPSLLYPTHLPSLKYPTPRPICLCALCKEVAAISRGAPAPLLPAHAPRHPAREAKAQSLVWWPGLTAAKAQIQSGGLCECAVAPWPS